MAHLNINLPPDERLPSAFIEALTRYVNEGTDPGAFLRAVLENDLVRSIELGMPGSVRHLPALVDYCTQHLPCVCWKHRMIVVRWMKERTTEI